MRGPGAPGRNRTCDSWFRKPLLYPLSYGGGEVQATYPAIPNPRQGSPTSPTSMAPAGSPAYLDTEVFSDGDGSYRFGRAQSHVGPAAQREPLGCTPRSRVTPCWSWPTSPSARSPPPASRTAPTPRHRRQTGRIGRHPLSSG